MNKQTGSFFLPLFLLVLCFLVVTSPPSLEARSWFPLEPPTPETKTALATLIEGDETWVGYANYGVVLYDYYGQIVTKITPKEGLPGPTVTDLVKREKELWIATSDGLAMRNEGGGLKVFTARDGLPDNGITCLTVVGSVVYAGTMKGLVRFRGETFDVISEDKGLPAIRLKPTLRPTACRLNGSRRWPISNIVKQRFQLTQTFQTTGSFWEAPEAG